MSFIFALLNLFYFKKSAIVFFFIDFFTINFLVNYNIKIFQLYIIYILYVTNYFLSKIM